MPIVPDLDAWDAWRPEEVARRLEGIDAPWCVVGGWALDLWHGQETREHEDLEIATTRVHFDAFRQCLADHRLYVAGGGEVRPLAADETPPERHHQVWIFDPEAESWRMDLLLEPGDDETWICRRDASIRLPRERVAVRTPSGVPYLLPQFVLLFKAKATRPKDDADFDLALPRLDPSARTWLRDALKKIHPNHPWIFRIDAEGV